MALTPPWIPPEKDKSTPLFGVHIDTLPLPAFRAPGEYFGISDIPSPIYEMLHFLTLDGNIDPLAPLHIK